jgi:hypothetical protein
MATSANLPGGTPRTRAQFSDLNRAAKQNARDLNGLLALIETLELNLMFLDGVLPDSKAFRTSDFPNKDIWSKENLPDLLFYITLPPTVEKKKPKTFIRDDGVELKKFKVLPDYISIDTEGMLSISSDRPRLKI